MKNFICLYKVEIIEECLTTENKAMENPTKEEEGLLYADSFVDAVSQLENHLYGTSLCKILEIELFDTMAIFSHSTMELIRKELNEL